MQSNDTGSLTNGLSDYMKGGYMPGIVHPSMTTPPKANDVQVGGSHYKEMGVQPWDVMEAVLTREEFIGYLRGNIIKYAMRQGRKDENDAGKALHYMQKLAEVMAKTVTK